VLLVDDEVEVVEMVGGCACFSRASFGRIPSNFCGDNQFLPRAEPIEHQKAYQIGKESANSLAAHKDEECRWAGQYRVWEKR
jgi:hypothetical protein